MELLGGKWCTFPVFFFYDGPYDCDTLHTHAPLWNLCRSTLTHAHLWRNQCTVFTHTLMYEIYGWKSIHFSTGECLRVKSVMYGPSYFSNTPHSHKILTKQQGWSWGVSSVGNPQQALTGLTWGVCPSNMSAKLPKLNPLNYWRGFTTGTNFTRPCYPWGVRISPLALTGFYSGRVVVEHLLHLLDVPC